ncbi:hypothetical protein AcW1_008069 [Taiwanofungus camphoratus]|nr:hypothetical protein AcW1_008069 [Antrodia cinnamomea]
MQAQSSSMQQATRDYIQLYTSYQQAAGRLSRDAPVKRKHIGISFGPKRPSRCGLASVDEDPVNTGQSQISSSGSKPATRTAAQEIAARYRAARAEKESREAEESSVASRISHTETTCGDASTSITSIADTSEPKVRYRQSSAAALEGHRREAYLMSLQGGSGGLHTNIRCRRLGCNKVLSDLMALAAHLHMHDLDPITGVHAQHSSYAWVHGAQPSRHEVHPPPAPAPAPTRPAPPHRGRFKTFLKLVTYVCCVPYCISLDGQAA